MSYYPIFLWPDPEDGSDPRVEEGDTVASGTGYAAWSEWLVPLAEKYPAADALAEHGWSEDPEALEHDLHAMLGEAGATEDVRAVTASLLAAVKGRPDGCAGVAVTDGTPGDPDGEGNGED